MNIHLKIALLASACLVSLACGVAQQAPQEATDDGSPKYGGTLKTRHTGDPYDWDITYTGKARPMREGRALAYNSLLGFKAAPGVGYTENVIRPELAHKWEVNADATAFTFHLNKGVKYANLPPVNGREFTSADVKWAFEYLARTGEFKELPKANTGWMFEGMQAIETPDPYTAIVRFKDPFAPFLNYVAHDFVYITPKEIYEKDGHHKDLMVGTGAYQLDQSVSQKGSRWVYKKNPSYWEQGKPYIDEVQMLVLPDDGAAHAAFQTKQVDWLDELNPQEAKDLQARAPDAITYEYTDNPVHVYMNNSQPPFDNIKVRQAVFLSINRDEFIQSIASGKGGWALAGAPSGFMSQEEVKQIAKYDPEAAKKLLAEAGYPNGLTVDIHFPTDRGQIFITHMELLQSQLKKGGINLTAKGMTYNVFSPLRKKGEHTIQITGKDVTADADSYMYAVFYPGSGNNYDRVNDPKLNELLLAQRREADPTKRREVIKQAMRYLSTDCYCGLAIYYGSQYQVWQPYLKNYAPNWHVNGWAIENSWLEK